MRSVSDAAVSWRPPGVPELFQPVRVAFETARLRLAEIRGADTDARRSAYELACRLSATTLGVERVSVWSFRDDGATLRCDASFDEAAAPSPVGHALSRARYPSYFHALLTRRAIAAHEAMTDPVTSELRDYLVEHGVGALLDAPVYREGRVIGVVCHEHRGGPRRWTQKDADFASAVADMLTILVEQGERAELQAALDAERQAQAQAQKMEALRRLARIATHDLNNVLNVAILYSELITRGHDPQPMARQIADVLAYSAKLVGQLGAFCEDRPCADVVDLAQLVAGLGPALRALLGETAELDLRVDGDELRVRMSAVEGEQLVLNLCMNARDAIAERGHVSVHVGRETGSGNVVLRIADDGVGMDEAVQARIFEPYYSTKASHTGVGLMAVYGIVQRAGGSIGVDSAPGRGTTFRIALPRAELASSQEFPWAI